MLKRPHHPAEAPSYVACFDPVSMIGIVLTAGSALMQAKNTLDAGKAEQQAGRARQQALEHQAAQARQNAGQERASSQRAATEERRQGRFMASRALALAAASGAGAGDPTVENILGDIGAEGEFRALTELFIGEERARGLETQADLMVFEGEQERRAGDIARRSSKGKAFAQVLSGAGKAASGAYQAGYFDTKPNPYKSPPGPHTTAGSGSGLSRYG